MLAIYTLWEATGGAWMSQEEPGGARKSQEEPGGARRSQESPCRNAAKIEPGCSWVEPGRSHGRSQD
jgi:hypothetical protein